LGTGTAAACGSVSGVMKTRVETVIPYWTRFVERWPDVRALAAARPEDVRAAWSGLGYYRRAELMLRAAHAVVERHDGVAAIETGSHHMGTHKAGAAGDQTGCWHVSSFARRSFNETS
jgi:acyl-CoA reductase-like NAD-dependent aldehyde dehydrogenase